MRGWTPEAIADAFRRAGEAPPSDLGDIKRHKYNARKKEIDGITFDSCAEARAYQDLKFQQQRGLIADLELQPRYLLQDGFRDDAGKWHRKVEYVADFRFVRIDGKIQHRIVVDVKGMQTPTFRLKEKLFRAKYPHITLEIWTKGRIA